MPLGQPMGVREGWSPLVRKATAKLLLIFARRVAPLANVLRQHGSSLRSLQWLRDCRATCE